MSTTLKKACNTTAVKQAIKCAYEKNPGSNSPKWDLVKQYLPLLKSIVSRMILHFPSTIDKEDVYTMGLLGLISATQGFDEAQGYSFGAYAAIRIKGSLLDELRRIDWLPRSLRLKVKVFKEQVNALEQSLGRTASEEEICAALRLDKHAYQKLKNYSKPLICIPLEIGAGGSGGEEGDERYSLQEVLADITQENSREIFEKKEIRQILKEHLKTLPLATQKLFALYYVEGLRLAEIAKVFGVTESRVCQIHSEAIGRLRKQLIRSLKN